MAYHAIRSKLDRALVLWIINQAAGTSADTVPAKSALDKNLPITICHTARAVEDPAYSGNFRCDTDIIVRSIAAPDLNQTAPTLKDSSDARVAAVFDAFHVDLNTSGNELAAQITTVARAAAVADPDTYSDLADLTLLDVRPVSEEGAFDDEGNAWQDSLKLEIVAVPSDVS